METITANWAEIALALITAAGTITALSESEKDDRVIDVAKRILNAVILGKGHRRRRD